MKGSQESCISSSRPVSFVLLAPKNAVKRIQEMYNICVKKAQVTKREKKENTLWLYTRLKRLETVPVPTYPGFSYLVCISIYKLVGQLEDLAEIPWL